jgi:hypothetical protein
MIEPYKAYRDKAYRVFAEVALKLKIELGLEITNHRTRKVRSENLRLEIRRNLILYNDFY